MSIGNGVGEPKDNWTPINKLVPLATLAYAQANVDDNALVAAGFLISNLPFSYMDVSRVVSVPLSDDEESCLYAFNKDDKKDQSIAALMRLGADILQQSVECSHMISREQCDGLVTILFYVSPDFGLPDATDLLFNFRLGSLADSSTAEEIDKVGTWLSWFFLLLESVLNTQRSQN